MLLLFLFAAVVSACRSLERFAGHPLLFALAGNVAGLGKCNKSDQKNGPSEQAAHNSPGGSGGCDPPTSTVLLRAVRMA